MPETVQPSSDFNATALTIAYQIAAKNTASDPASVEAARDHAKLVNELALMIMGKFAAAKKIHEK